MAVSVAASLQLLIALQLIAISVALTSYMFPYPAVLQPNSTATVIVVGAGTAGSIVATRLAENPNVSVILIEKGGDPPPESTLTGLYPLMPRSVNDWSYKAVNDNRIAQNTKNKSIEVTMGKMLGGTSSLNHASHTRGHKKDYDDLAEIVGDDTWNYENMLPYLKKPENMVDKEILATGCDTYGTDGYVTLTKSHEKATEKYLDAFDEIGCKKKIDTNGLDVLGCAEPVLYISEDGIRQSVAQTYLVKLHNKPNVKVLKNTEVTEIIIKNGAAIGVVARNETGEFEIYAENEIVISAGAINTPKLLLQSGIGPRNDLEALGIEVKSDLPVGENLQDHATVLFVHKMGLSNSTILTRDPHKYPVPIFTGYVNIINNGDSAAPHYRSINLIFEHDSPAILQLSSACFNLNDNIGETWFNASVGHEVLLTALSLLHPENVGTVKLRSNNYADEPLIDLNWFGTEDLNNVAEYLQHYSKILKSTYFKSVDAEFVNLDVGCGVNDNSLEFWKCYALALCVSIGDYSGTCPLGSVVDTNLKVFGIDALRIVDASVIPKTMSSFLMSPVMAIAEKAADIIKSANNF